MTKAKIDKFEQLIKELSTVDGHTKGSRMPVSKDHWLLIAGCDSDIGQAVMFDLARVGITAKGEQAKTDDRIKGSREIYARLVIGWSLPEDCTYAKVLELINKARYLSSEIAMHFQTNANFTKP